MIQSSIKFDKDTLITIGAIKNIPNHLVAASRSAMETALSIVAKKAKQNVTGGIIGGKSRMDGQEGLLARSIEINIRKRGKTLWGSVGISPSSPGWIAGIVQEEGYDAQIFSKGRKPMAFLHRGDKVFTHSTDGVPASHWLETSFNQTKNKAKQSFKSIFAKVVRRISTSVKSITATQFTHTSSLVAGFQKYKR